MSSALQSDEMGAVISTRQMRKTEAYGDGLLRVREAGSGGADRDLGCMNPEPTPGAQSTI